MRSINEGLTIVNNMIITLKEYLPKIPIILLNDKDILLQKKCWGRTIFDHDHPELNIRIIFSDQVLQHFNVQGLYALLLHELGHVIIAHDKRTILTSCNFNSISESNFYLKYLETNGHPEDWVNACKKLGLIDPRICDNYDEQLSPGLISSCGGKCE